MVDVLPRPTDASTEAGVRVLIGIMVLVDTASASESRVKNKHHALLITEHLSKCFKSVVGGSTQQHCMTYMYMYMYLRGTAPGN